MGTFGFSHIQTVNGDVEFSPAKQELQQKPLTLHAESVGTVVGLEHRPVAVLTPVLGRRIAALPPPPLSALCATRRPFGPVGPATVHWG